MELFDLEIPIRAVGDAQVKATIKEVEAQAKATDAVLSKPSTLQVDAKAAVANLASVGEAAKTAGSLVVDGINREIAARMEGAASTEQATQTVEALRQAEADLASGLQAGAIAAEKRTQAESELAAVRARLAAIKPPAPITTVVAPGVAQQATSVADAILSIQTKAAQLRADFKANDISALQFSRSMAVLNAQVRNLAASEGITEAETRALNGLLVRTTTTAKGFASQGLDVVRASAIAMVPAMIGAEGAAGGLIATLLGFATTGGVTLAIVAGIGLLVASYRQMTSAQREAKKTSDELIDSLKRQAKQEDESAGAALRAVKARRDALAAEIAAGPSQTDAAAALLFAGPGAGFNTLLDEHQARKREELAKLDRLLGIAERNVAKESNDARASQVASIIQFGQALADNIRLHGADAAATRNAAANERLLTTIGHDARRSIEERNAALSAAAAIHDALHPKEKRHRDDIEDASDLIRDQVALLGELSGARGLTGDEIAQLGQIIATVDNLQASANLTDAKQLELLKARTDAVKLLAAATAASIPQHPTFGRDTSVAPTPALPTGFNVQPEAPAFGGGFGNQVGGGAGSALGDFKGVTDRAVAGTRQLVKAVTTTAADGLGEIRETFASGIAQSIGDGIAAGFAQLFSSGSIGEGFTSLTAALLQGIGSAMVQFGEAALVASTLMKSIKDSLASFLPGGAITASLAMIAVGAAIGGIGGSLAGSAQSSFGGGSSASVAAAPQVTVARVGSFGFKTPTERAPTTTVNAPVTVIGNDPAAWREVSDKISTHVRRKLG